MRPTSMLLLLHAALLMRPIRALLLLHASSRPPLTTATVRAAPVRMMPASVDEYRAVCAALQNGEAPPELAEMVSTRAGVRGFLTQYLRGDEYTCADKEAPPAALISCLECAPAEVVEVMLMNVALGALRHGPLERECARARALVDALWHTSPIMQRSCGAFIEAVGGSLGEGVREYDASAGDIELLRIQWSSLLQAVRYDEAQLTTVRTALLLCGDDDADGGDDESEQDE